MAAQRVVVVGGGHNGLVAAILAAQSGAEVILLEAADHLGGATVGDSLFPGHPARLSRYSYLVSLFPQELTARLGILLPLRSRAVSSYTPTRRNGPPDGLLVERTPGAATEESFRRLTGSDAEFTAWQRFYGEAAALAQALAPALTGPLRTAADVAAAADAAGVGSFFDELTHRPLGEIITERFADDTVRGVVATDGLIGTHTSLFETSLLANRCFLYHVIGRGTGEWLVPVGGMGAVRDALLARAQQIGVQICTGSEVKEVVETPAGVALLTADGNEFRADKVFAAVAPCEVDRWFGRNTPPPEGAQLKINMLLTRLPRLASGADPDIVFAGTTHLEEGFSQLEQAFAQSLAGVIGDLLPGEVYCHSLTDPSILGGWPGATLTLFGLHTPASMFRTDPVGAKERATAAALASLQRHLAEPLEDCLARDAAGALCVEVATPLDLEQSLRMPGGHIFHGDLSWPWLAPNEQPETTAQRYGVDVPESDRILVAGAGTRRGGGVSGLGGAAAVDAWLTDQGR